MELRSCDTTHFIQTIRGGLVLKVCNIISHERPVIRTKILKDVYESEDAKRLQKPPSGLVFDHQQVKHESPCFLVADRRLREIEPATDEFAPLAADDLGGDLEDDTTLKQLKKGLLTKKRKCVPIDENLQQDNANEKAAQDESDLNEPLINWKPKHSKTSKAKRKHLKILVISSSTIHIAIKSEERLVSECSPQVGGVLAPISRVKDEIPAAKQLECQNKISSDDASSIGHNEVPNPGQKMVLNECNREPQLCLNTYENCTTNEISYDHLEDVEPVSILALRNGTSVELETPETACSESLDVPSVEIDKQREIQDSHSWRESLSMDPNPDLCCHSRSSSSVEDMPEEGSISGSRVPDTAIDGCMGLHQECNSVPSEDKAEADFINEPKASENSFDKNCGPNLVSITPSKAKENPSLMDDTIAPETIFTPEANQPPERLLLSRKAFSPQEQLRLVMNSDEVCNNSNQNISLECKEKLFENKTEKKESSPRSDIKNGEITADHRRPGQVSQRKVTISPRRIIRKSQIAKGNLEGPHFSRALPSVNTACTSVQGCSEGATAFAQRQMHDMETLAEKLMKELKSMKDIVEQKLLFEAYRNASIKNDAAEVKSAINNATKVENIAKRWMSMMARDCTRFCKIMKMTPESTLASKDGLRRERRKITFADEAGGELCHIRYYDDGIAAPEAEADAVKQ